MFMHVPPKQLAIVFVLAATLFSGCFLNPLSGCRNNLMHHEWVDSGLYEEMPPNGTYGDYVVRRGQFQNDSLIEAVAHNSDHRILLTVFENDRIEYEISSDRRFSDDVVGDKLRQAYEILGLGEPALADWDFKWAETGC